MSNRQKPSSVLFSLTSADHYSEAFLFGTMHVNSDSAFSYADVAQETMDGCTMFASEIDMGIAPSQNISQLLQLKDTSLSELYSPKKYSRLSAYLKKYFGMNLDQFDDFVPFFLLNLLNEQILNQGSRKALDVFLFEYAVKKGLKTTGLEDFDTHYQVLQQIPYKEQARQLEKVLTNISHFRKNIFKISEYYADANIRQLYRLTRQSLGKMRRIMLYDRNKIMAERIVELSANDRLFAACGVSHLSGQFGLLSLLKQAGFRVVPIYEV